MLHWRGSFMPIEETFSPLAHKASKKKSTKSGVKLTAKATLNPMNTASYYPTLEKWEDDYKTRKAAN